MRHGEWVILETRSHAGLNLPGNGGKHFRATDSSFRVWTEKYESVHLAILHFQVRWEDELLISQIFILCIFASTEQVELHLVLHNTGRCIEFQCNHDLLPSLCWRVYKHLKCEISANYKCVNFRLLISLGAGAGLAASGGAWNKLSSDNKLSSNILRLSKRLIRWTESGVKFDEYVGQTNMERPAVSFSFNDM